MSSETEAGRISELEAELAELRQASIRRSGASSWEEFTGIWNPTEEAAVDAITRLAAELAAARQEVDRLLNVARGCHDYGGGYRDAEYEIFQHGISTVVRALVMAASASNDPQVNALEMIGKQAAIDDIKEAPDAE